MSIFTFYAYVLKLFQNVIIKFYLKHRKQGKFLQKKQFLSIGLKDRIGFQQIEMENYRTQLLKDDHDNSCYLLITYFVPVVLFAFHYTCIFRTQKSGKIISTLLVRKL